MNKFSNFVKVFFLCGVVTIGVIIGLSLPISADPLGGCDGSCRTEPWGPEGENMTFCDFTNPGGFCDGNDGGPCGNSTCDDIGWDY